MVSGWYAVCLENKQCCPQKMAGGVFNNNYEGEGMRMMAAVIMVLALGANAASLQAQEISIAKDRKVKLEYTLIVDGQVVESTEGKQPLEYTQGQGMLIPGLEKGLEGMKVNEKKSVDVLAVEGYGQINPQLVREFERSRLPQDLVPEPGIILEMQDPQGNGFPCTIVEVMDKTVKLDFNHPLAGKDLRFDVTIVAVE
jgi:FKBP-type peptidyl-prolyl cis-trans isomerase SlpA